MSLFQIIVILYTIPKYNADVSPKLNSAIIIVAMKSKIKYMRMAVRLAEQGRGRTSPNPMVGAVIVRDGVIVGEGWHRRAGTPHAERHALESAGEKAKGADIYVNLEPCSHQGRTPPCAPALVRAGIARVFIGMRDPNPLVAGRGIKILEDAGLHVESGILEKECLRLNEAFVKHITTGLPFVILKGAMTLDGKTATKTGESKWITCGESRALVHKLRGEVDAVIVGSGTMLCDDPSLTSRIESKIKDPYRVVLDSKLKTEIDSNFCKLAADGKSIIVTTRELSDEKAVALADAGCRVIRVRAGGNGSCDLEDTLRKLGGMDVASVMVEGGGELHFSLLEAGLADKVMVFIAPKLLGGRGSKTLVEGDGFPAISSSATLKDIRISNIGTDLLVEAYLNDSGSV